MWMFTSRWEQLNGREMNSWHIKSTFYLAKSTEQAQLEERWTAKVDICFLNNWPCKKTEDLTNTEARLVTAELWSQCSGGSSGQRSTKLHGFESHRQKRFFRNKVK